MISKKLLRQAFLVLAGLTICAVALCAQDKTQNISLQDAETLFLKRNLQLIAERYNIDMAQAQVTQAKIFDNPSFEAAIDIYNPDNRKWFDASKATGQYVFSIEQVIRLGGKRKKEILLAKMNVETSENQFYELLRNLRFELRSAFYELYYLSRSLDAFDTQIALLEDTQLTYKELEKRGQVALSELVRIRSLLYSLQSDKLELQNQFNEKQADLQLLLQDNQTVFTPVIAAGDFAFINPEDLSLSQLVEKARSNRSDLKLAEKQVDISKKDLSLQKVSGIPDLVIGAEYDKQGNFTENLFCLKVGFDLPVFNRNQGNIRVAKTAVSQSETLLEQKQMEIENEVQKNYLNALHAHKANQSIDSSFESDLQLLLQNITENFKKKNISLLEFTDFYESYRDNVIKINQIQNMKAQSMEELRFSTN